MQRSKAKLISCDKIVKSNLPCNLLNAWHGMWMLHLCRWLQKYLQSAPQIPVERLKLLWIGSRLLFKWIAARSTNWHIFTLSTTENFPRVLNYGFSPLCTRCFFSGFHKFSFHSDLVTRETIAKQGKKYVCQKSKQQKSHENHLNN